MFFLGKQMNFDVKLGVFRNILAPLCNSIYVALDTHLFLRLVRRLHAFGLESRVNVIL